MSQAMLPLVMMMMMMSSSVLVGAFLLLGGEEEDSGGMDDYNDFNDQSEDDSEPESASTSSSTTPSSPTPPSSSPPPPPEHCKGSWSSTPCSATCGGGTKTKTWTTTQLPRYGGGACPSVTTKVVSCNSQPCSVAEAPAGATS